MNSKKPSKQEQIDALIHHRAYDLVIKYAPSKDIDDAEAYRDVFTVKRSEILDYLTKNGRFGDLVRITPSDRDGFYAIPNKNSFNTYEQERNFKAMEKNVPDVQSVWDLFLDYIIRTSGAGLKFSDAKD